MQECLFYLFSPWQKTKLYDTKVLDDTNIPRKTMVTLWGCLVTPCDLPLCLPSPELWGQSLKEDSRSTLNNKASKIWTTGLHPSFLLFYGRGKGLRELWLGCTLLLPLPGVGRWFIPCRHCCKGMFPPLSRVLRLRLVTWLLSRPWLLSPVTAMFCSPRCSSKASRGRLRWAWLNLVW